MAGAERLCHIFEWGREPISYFEMGSRNEKGWEPLHCTVSPHQHNTASFLFYSVCIALLLFDNNNPSNEFRVCSEFTSTGRHSDAVLLKGASNAFLAFIPCL